MENNHEVDKPAKARVPCRDTPVRITGHVNYKKGGRKVDALSENILVDL